MWTGFALVLLAAGLAAIPRDALEWAAGEIRTVIRELEREKKRAA